MQRWAYTPISEVNAHSKSHPSGNLGWIKRYVSIREHGIRWKWLLQWFILINQGLWWICSSGWKGPYTHSVHTTYAVPWKCRPSLGGRCLKARRLCLHSFTAAAVLIPHCYCQVMEHFRQITAARKRKHSECGKKTSAIWDVSGDRFALLLTRVLTAQSTNLCSTAGDNKRAF